MVASIEGLQSFDPYQILELDSAADEKAIRKQYRKMSLLKHPDKNPDNPLAVQEFIRLTKAYNVSLYVCLTHGRFWQMKQLVRTFWSTGTRTVLATIMWRLLCLAFYCRKRTKSQFCCVRSSFCWLLSQVLFMWTLQTAQSKTRAVFCWKTNEYTALKSTSIWFSRMCRLLFQSQSSSKRSRPTLSENSICFGNWKTTQGLKIYCRSLSRGNLPIKT